MNCFFFFVVTRVHIACIWEHCTCIVYLCICIISNETAGRSRKLKLIFWVKLDTFPDGNTKIEKIVFPVMFDFQRHGFRFPSLCFALFHYTCKVRLAPRIVAPAERVVHLFPARRCGNRRITLRSPKPRPWAAAARCFGVFGRRLRSCLPTVRPFASPFPSSRFPFLPLHSHFTLSPSLLCPPLLSSFPLHALPFLPYTYWQ